MGVNQALEVLGKALELANARHAFGLADASLIQTAYSVIVQEFRSKEEQNKQDEPLPEQEEKPVKKAKK